MTIKSTWTILCVDDEKDILDSLCDTFVDAYQVLTATNAQDALDIFAKDKETIFLVISDQRMPQMEGTEFLAKINEIKPSCKKIILTGYSDAKATVDAINQSDVDKYLNKPWNTETLIDTVAKLHKEYKTDEFFNKIIKDTKGLIESSKKTKESSQLFEGFLDSFLDGVCIVDGDLKIDYINKAGLEILNYTDMAQLKGMDFKEIFLLTDMSQKGFQEKYQNKDSAPESLHVKKGNGSIANMLLNITFIEDETGGRVNGIVFKAPAKG